MPDYEKFGLNNGLSEGMYNLLSRRVYDIAGITNKTLNVTLEKKL